LPIDGDSDTVSPSKMSCQSVGVKGVTTRPPHPHAQEWTAVAYSIVT
jgi:hypothetical protein